VIRLSRDEVIRAIRRQQMKDGRPGRPGKDSQIQTLCRLCVTGKKHFICSSTICCCICTEPGFRKEIAALAAESTSSFAYITQLQKLSLGE